MAISKHTMKILVNIILLVSLTTLGQSVSVDEKNLMEKADAYLVALNTNEAKDLPTDEDRLKVRGETDISLYSSLKAYETFNLLVEKYPSSEKFIYYLYYKSLSALEYENYAVAKDGFLKIVELNHINWQYYTRKSYIFLAEIAVTEKDYISAQMYLERKSKKSLMGHEIRIEELQLKYLNEKITEGLKRK